MPPREDSLSWATPEWWVRPNRGFREISRDRFIKLWTDAMARPKPNVTLLRDESKGWISDLGRRAWIVQLYTKACADALYSDTTVLRYEVEVWNNTTEAFADYVDPLMRISSSYQQSAKDQRPIGLPAALNEPLRQLYLSDTCGAARRALILSDDCGQITTTKGSADQFLADPTRAGDQVYAAAMRGFASGLVKWVDKLLESSDGALDPEILETLYSKIDYLSETFGEPDALLRKPTQEEIDIVETELNRVISDNPALVRRKGKMLSGFTSSVATEDDVVGDAWVRARKYLLKNLIEGDPMQPEKTFLLKLKWTIVDLKRRELKIMDHFDQAPDEEGERNAAHETSHAAATSGSYGLARADLQFGQVELRSILGTAAKNLETARLANTDSTSNAGGKLSWEDSLTIQILLTRADATYARLVRDAGGSLEKFLTTLYEQQSPRMSTFASARDSAKHVGFLLQKAIASAVSDENLVYNDLAFGSPEYQVKKTQKQLRNLARREQEIMSAQVESGDALAEANVPEPGPIEEPKQAEGSDTHHDIKTWKRRSDHLIEKFEALRQESTGTESK